MLWVVLGWLDAIAFIEKHSAAQYPSSAQKTTPGGSESGEERRDEGTWHAMQFLPPFSHRSRIFYTLASAGWDERLCAGGMLWAPGGLPYKNAITNQLWIAASVAMYLHFPGDANCAPFVGTRDDWECGEGGGDDGGRYDERFLEHAVKGYAWLVGSGMRNGEGLYTDGFHISGYAEGGTKCDQRDETVWSYNQGVILSGLRGLWEGTGDASYLSDGHDLIRAVRTATGWSGASEGSLGADGVLTERCDPSSTCSQDAQSFKGIFAHHLTAFCAPLPATPAREGKTFAADKKLRDWHREACKDYTGWVILNARAAMRTRDGEGRFGGWWGARRREGEEDPNERGRGRTAETQGAGMAIVRAGWEFKRLGEEDGAVCCGGGMGLLSREG